MADVEWLVPDWPAPARVRAASSLRAGGTSAAPYDSLNLGLHVGDDAGAVNENRRRLRAALRLPVEPTWLEQVHGTRVVRAADPLPGPADAAVVDAPGQVGVIMTADCLPVLLAERSGRIAGLAHAGWRGLADGVIEATVAEMAVPGPELIAWLGPAIGPRAFEVGEEVRAAFVAADPGAAAAFVPSPAGRWLADLYRLATRRLQALGIASIHGGGLCTHGDSGRFFSHRRDRLTGRMATLVWLEPG